MGKANAIALMPRMVWVAWLREVAGARGLVTIWQEFSIFRELLLNLSLDSSVV